MKYENTTPLPEVTWRALVSPRPEPATLFAQCVEAVTQCWWDCADGEEPASETITRAVIQTLIDYTESPRTCDELTRVLAEAGE